MWTEPTYPSGFDTLEIRNCTETRSLMKRWNNDRMKPTSPSDLMAHGPRTANVGDYATRGNSFGACEFGLQFPFTFREIFRVGL
jgi:hypothetical protein